jgi:hypothetical protein
MVLGRDGKQVLDDEGYEICCGHGRPVDLDDEETDNDGTECSEAGAVAQ